MDVEVNREHADDPTLFGTSHSDIDTLSVEELQAKLDEGYGSLDDSYEGAPSNRDFLDVPNDLDEDYVFFAGEIRPTIGGQDSIVVTRVWYDKKDLSHYEYDAFEKYSDGASYKRADFGPLYAAWD